MQIYSQDNEWEEKALDSALDLVDFENNYTADENLLNSSVY